MQKQDLINVVLQCTAKFQERFDSDSKPDVMKRQSILDSEVNETIQAIKDNDLVEILDGYCDILYVLGGSFDKFKHDKNQQSLYLDWINVRLEQALKYFSLECIFDAFYDVHKSNMSKVHKDLHSVFDTVKKYQLDTNDFRLKKVSENEYLVYDNKINKLLKPENYLKANLKPILEKYGYIA
jgi:predicted HAD superfamily Cof-like phosphohydrolase